MNELFTYKPYDKQLDKIAYYSGIIILFGGLISLLILEICNIDFTEIPAPCLLYSNTGFYCPGCGGTRATKYLLTGHIFKSIYYNPFVAYIFFPWLWFLLTQTIYRFSAFSKKLHNKYLIRLLKPITVRPLYLYIGIGLLLVQWIMKNIAYISGHAPF